MVALLLAPVEKRLLKKVMECMRDFHSVMFALQSESCTMGQVRKLFDGIMRRYPTMDHYIHPTSEIIHSPLFESALVKLESGQALTEEEKVAAQGLLVGVFFWQS